MKDECLIEKYNQCCCNCMYLIADQSHPHTDGNYVSHQRGWICMGFLSEGMRQAFSGWSQHGMCELWEPLETTKITLPIDSKIAFFERVKRLKARS